MMMEPTHTFNANRPTLSRLLSPTPSTADGFSANEIVSKDGLDGEVDEKAALFVAAMISFLTKDSFRALCFCL
jgi:hypothetical protein